MLESSIDNDADSQALSRRPVNTISLLLPAREYKLVCSWTTERPLPAIEEFACRLLLILGSVSPSELAHYFGLSARERDGLLQSLLKKRLVEVNEDGDIQAASVLQAKARADGGVPTLTTYETREESAVFDLLTFLLLPRRSYPGVKYGLPEVPPPANFGSVGMDNVVEAFSSQYRAHLEYTMQRGPDVQKTRLYKVGSCRQERTIQVPVDMEVTMEVGPDGDLRTYRDVVERFGETRRRPLTNELEAQIADYLAGLKVSSAGLSFEEFCKAIGDDVLLRYCRGSSFDFSRWLVDREQRKTGYGNPATTSLMGPMYLRGNRTTVLKRLAEAVQTHDREGLDPTIDRAYWLPAAVPLWSANGTDLNVFINAFQKECRSSTVEIGKLVTLFNTKEPSEKTTIKKKFNPRLPHAAALWGDVVLDRTELLVVPGCLAVAQYHIQPNAASAVTIPIGHVTAEAERIERISSLLRERVSRATNCEVLWSNTSMCRNDLVDIEWLGMNLTFEDAGTQAAPVRQKPEIRWRRPRS